MANIGALKAWVPFEVPLSADMNANFAEIKSKFNTYAVQTDVQRTMSVDLLFTDALYDIGKAGATRPRDIFASRYVNAAQQVQVSGVPRTSGANAIGVVIADTVTGAQTPGFGSRVSFQSNAGSAVAEIAGEADGAGTNNETALSFYTQASAGLLLRGLKITKDSSVVIGIPTALTGLLAGEVALGAGKWVRGYSTHLATQIGMIRHIGFGLNPAVYTATQLGDGQKPISLNVDVNTNAGGNFNGGIPGEVIIPNLFSLTQENAGKTDYAQNVFRVDAGVVIIGTTLKVGASAGDVVLYNGRSVRGVNAAVTSTKQLIGLIGGSDAIYIGLDLAGPIAFGNPPSLTAAGVGEVVTAQNKHYRSADNAGTSTFPLIGGAASGSLNVTQIGVDGGSIIGLGAPATFTSAAVRDVVLANAKSLRGANAAGTSTIPLISLNASDQLELVGGGGNDVKWGRAVVALGGGAAATLGTIGGSGPASAAQVGWERLIDASGNVRFFPVWA